MIDPKPQSNPRISAVRTARATASAGESNACPMDETEFLLSSPENARRLRRSIADVKAGKTFERELIECD